MFAKVSTGGGYSAAARYDEEGLTPEQKAKKAGNVEFLGSYNLMSNKADLIAREMVAVASTSRSQQPCWNVSLSAGPGQVLTNKEWQQAAEHYMRRIGADPIQHQAAIWRHSDTKHDHVHILINAVPLDGGPALLRYNSHYKAKAIARELDKMYPVTVKPRPEQKIDTRQEISRKLASVMSQRPTTSEELKNDLLAAGVRVNYGSNKNGIFGVTFQLADTDHKPLKGSAIQLDEQSASQLDCTNTSARWANLATILEANRSQYQAEIERLKIDNAEKQKQLGGYYDYVEELKSTHDQEITKVTKDLLKRYNEDTGKANQKPAVEIEKIIYKPDPEQAKRIAELEQENKVLKRELDLQARVTASFEKKFNHTPTPAQIRALRAGKRLNMPLIGLCVWIEDNKWRSEPLRIKTTVATETIPKEKTGIAQPAQNQGAGTLAPAAKLDQTTPAQKRTDAVTLDPVWLKGMYMQIKQAAQESTSMEGLKEKLKALGIVRIKETRPDSTTRIIYRDTKTKQEATGAQLGFKQGEIQQLIDKPLASKQSNRLGR